MTSSSETFKATRASLLPGLSGAYRAMLGGAALLAFAFFVIDASPHMAAPALLTFDAAGTPSLELLEPLPEPVGSRGALFVGSDPREHCTWAVTLPAGATAPHEIFAITSVRSTNACASPRPGAVHGSLIAVESARPLSAILVPGLRSRR